MRIRTGYSFRHSVGHLYDVHKKLSDCGLPLSITDRSSVFGWNKWSKLVKKNGGKPIFGVELAVTMDINEKKPIVDHWTFIAKDDIVSVNNLISIATSQFRYEPLLTYQQALDSGCIIIMGSRNISIPQPKEDLFYGLSPELPYSLYKQYKEAGIQPIMCCNNNFVNEEDRDYYEIIISRGSNDEIFPQWILSVDEWSEYMLSISDQSDIDMAIYNMRIMSDKCTASLKVGELYKPDKPATLLQMCIEGAEDLGLDIEVPEYKARLKKELDLIASKDFEDYFYIIADMVQWARKNMIVGPARGSSCGSLVCYLLKITTVDPLKYDLIFERFIDMNRSDLPDIDIDFSDQKRHLVFQYMAEKYGEEKIARLGTVAMYHPKSAVAEAGKVLGIPKWKTDAGLESLVQRSSGDSRALDTLEDTLKTTEKGRQLLRDHPNIIIATKMEGHPRHYSQHAAGILLTEKPVSEYIAVDKRQNVTMCDKKDAEDLNLLKIDALGLTQLSVFEDCLEMIDKSYSWLDTIPLDDVKSFNILNDQKFLGIFQFNGLSLRSIVDRTPVTHIDHVIAITALSRPGPMTSGGTHRWVQRKNGTENITYPHPLFEPLLSETLGIVVYQEQVMEIGRQIGDFSWEEVTALRKAMSKSLGKEYFDQFGDKFKANAIKKGISPDVLTKIWDDLCAYGAWAFNKSHSVAYGLISYWCMYLKAHYPAQFITSTLNHEKDSDKQLDFLREMDKEGIKYIPVCPETSTDKWTYKVIDGVTTLVGPLSNVKGIGPKAMQTILSCKARGEPLPTSIAKKIQNAKTDIDILYPIDHRINELFPNGLEEANIITPRTLVENMENTAGRTFLCVGKVIKINPRDENEAINVAKRGGKVYTSGPLICLNMHIQDDTGILFCKISRLKYEKLGLPVVERGKLNNAIYAVKGKAPFEGRFIMVDAIRYLGDMEEVKEAEK